MADITIEPNLTHVQILCMNCGAGNSIEPEKMNEYYAELNNGKGIVVNHNVVVENACESCGCNMIQISGKLELVIS